MHKLAMQAPHPCSGGSCEPSALQPKAGPSVWGSWCPLDVVDSVVGLPHGQPWECLLQSFLVRHADMIAAPATVRQCLGSLTTRAAGLLGMHAPALPACSCSGTLTGLAVPPAEEHLGDLATWRKPTAGMFAWMKLQGGITDADQVIEYLKEEKVVVVPGRKP